MTKTSLTIPAVVAGALGMGSTIAWAAEPTTDELMKQIEQLQSKVQQLEARQTDSLNSRDVDATVDKVLRDAEKRSQLLQMEGMTAGWDEGFMIQSGDGNFVMRPFFHFQFRNVTNFRDDVPPDGDSDTQHGFEIPRMKIGAMGNVFSPDLTYNFRWASGENHGNGGSLVLENAYAQWFFSDDMALRLGQWKDPVFHEERTESYFQLAADRSLLNEVLGGGLTNYVQGVGLVFQPPDSQWRGMVSLHDGINTGNTSFLEGSGGITLVTGGAFAPNWGVSGRVDYLAQGSWRAYDDFTAMGNTDDLLVIGGGFNYTEAGSQDLILHTIDAQWENADGLGLYGAFVGAYADLDVENTYDLGLVLQAGWMMNEEWELFGRWSGLFLDDDAIASTSEDTFNEFTIGVNYYMHGHRAKFTADVTFLPDGIPDGTNLSNVGYLAGEGEDQFVIRGQFQLLL